MHAHEFDPGGGVDLVGLPSVHIKMHIKPFFDGGIKNKNEIIIANKLKISKKKNLLKPRNGRIIEHRISKHALQLKNREDQGQCKCNCVSIKITG